MIDELSVNSSTLQTRLKLVNETSQAMKNNKSIPTICSCGNQVKLIIGNTIKPTKRAASEVKEIRDLLKFEL